jgi:hypothetical protein
MTRSQTTRRNTTMSIKRILAGAALVTALAATVPTAASAAVFKTEEQAESYMTREYSDYYEDYDYELDEVTCDGVGRFRDGGDGADDRFRKFKCVSEYSDVDGEYGVTDTDSPRSRQSPPPERALSSDDPRRLAEWSRGTRPTRARCCAARPKSSTT